MDHFRRNRRDFNVRPGPVEGGRLRPDQPPPGDGGLAGRPAAISLVSNVRFRPIAVISAYRHVRANSQEERLLFSRLFSRAGSTQKGTRKEQWTVAGRGLERGSDWTPHLKVGGQDRDADLNWFGGILSGISLERNENLLAQHTFSEVVGRLDAFCAAYPNDLCHSAQKVAARLIWPAGGPDLPSSS